MHRLPDMTTLGITQEIFAHACCYYGSSVVKAPGVDGATVDDIYSRSNSVDMKDGGDNSKRIVAYYRDLHFASPFYYLESAFSFSQSIYTSFLSLSQKLPTFSVCQKLPAICQIFPCILIDICYYIVTRIYIRIYR